MPPSPLQRLAGLVRPVTDGAMRAARRATRLWQATDAPVVPPAAPAVLTPARAPASRVLDVPRAVRRRDQALHYNPRTAASMPRLAGSPDTRIYHEIPVTSTSDWDINSIRDALDEHDYGRFYDTSLLADWMLRDDRISSCLGTRTKAMLGLPFSLEPSEAGDQRRSKRIASVLEPHWSKVCSRATVGEFMRWGATMGFAIAQIVWNTEGPLWMPELEVWHPALTYYRQDTRQYVVLTQEGPVNITPGDGKWFVYAPHGLYRGWMHGAVRSLALLTMLRQYALRDWGRASEMYGMGVRVGKVPANCDKTDEANFINQLANLGSESVLLLPQGMEDRDGFDFDIKALEGDFKGEVFERLGKRADMGITLELLGQNLTSEVNEGSLAAARVHGDVRQDFLEADTATFSADYHDQVLVPWTVYNFEGANAEDAPIPTWDVEPPEDKDVKAKVLVQVSEAIETLSKVAPEVDRRALLEEFEIPLSSEAPGPDDEKGQIFEYHLQFGIVTVNEARAALGFPPIAGGDVAPTPPAPDPSGEPPPGAPPPQDAAQLAAALSSPKTFGTGQLYADRITNAALHAGSEALRPDVQAVLSAIDGASSMADLRKRLSVVFRNLSPDALAAEVEKATLLAHLAGRHSLRAETQEDAA